MGVAVLRAGGARTDDSRYDLDHSVDDKFFGYHVNAAEFPLEPAVLFVDHHRRSVRNKRARYLS